MSGAYFTTDDQVFMEAVELGCEPARHPEGRQGDWICTCAGRQHAWENAANRVISAGSLQLMRINRGLQPRRIA